MVSIDDLQALLDVLEHSDGITDDVVVQCDEGVFTEAEDLRKLSDETLNNLRIELNDLVVHLSRDRAEAIGPTELVDMVEGWARARQTAERPPGRPWLHLVAGAVTANVLGLMTASSVGLILALTGDAKMADLRYPLVLGVALLFLPITLLTWLIVRKYAENAATWAVIKPMTMQELREQRARATKVPLWALLVSVAALLVSLVFNALNYLLPNE